MSDKLGNSDRIFDGLVRRAMVPEGLRPQTDAEIEALLDALGQGDMSDAKFQRMLGKIHGTIPLSWEFGTVNRIDWESDSTEARELAEMFRAKGEELPLELEERLREMEERAAEFPGEEEDTDDE